MSKTFQNMLDTLDSLPRESPIIEQTDRLLRVLIHFEDDPDTRATLINVAEGLVDGRYIAVQSGGSVTG